MNVRIHSAVVATTSALALMAMTARADDSRFHHFSVVDYPPSLAGCQPEAEFLGARIAQMTGVEIFNAHCQQDWGDSYYLDITYVADAALNVVSTLNDDPNIYHQGLYRSLDDCGAAIDSQIAHFRRATGLEPIVSYCSKENGASDHRFALKIEGLGTPALTPHFFAKEVYGYLLGDGDAIAQSLARRLSERRGADVFGAVLAAELMESRFSIGYYGNRALHLSDHDDFGFESPEACAAATGRFSEIFTAGGEDVLGGFCARQELSSLSVLHLIALTDGSHLVTDIAPVSYDTKDACEAQREATAEIYRRDEHRSVFAAECAILSQTSYYVLVFSQPG